MDLQRANLQRVRTLAAEFTLSSFEGVEKLYSPRHFEFVAEKPQRARNILRNIIIASRAAHANMRGMFLVMVEIVKCTPRCNACMELVMKGRPAFCTRWDHGTREAYKTLFV